MHQTQRSFYDTRDGLVMMGSAHYTNFNEPICQDFQQASVRMRGRERTPCSTLPGALWNVNPCSALDNLPLRYFKQESEIFTSCLKYLLTSYLFHIYKYCISSISSTKNARISKKHTIHSLI